MVGLGGEGIPLAVWPLAAWTQASDTWRREEWPEGPSHRYCPDALLIGRVEVGETLTCHVTRLPSHIPSAQEHGSGEQKRGQPCVGECWRGQEVMRMGGEPGGWGRQPKGSEVASASPNRTAVGYTPAEDPGKWGQPLGCASSPLESLPPTPTGILGILSFSTPLTLPGSGDRSRLTTSRCGHRHEAMRGVEVGRGGGEGEAAARALWSQPLPCSASS